MPPSTMEKTELSSNDDSSSTADSLSVSSKKSVGFSTQVEYHRVLNRSDYKPEEKANTWYSIREYRQIRAANHTTVEQLMIGSFFVEEDEHCLRGLEALLPMVGEKQQQKRKYSTRSILRQQHFGEKAVPFEATRLYKTISLDCQAEAVKRGLSDAAAATQSNTPSVEVSAHQPRRPSIQRRIVPECA